MALTLRTVVAGSSVACAVWLLTDRSVQVVRLTQAEYDDFALTRGGQGEPARKPAIDAQFRLAMGGIPALNTPTGWAGPEDCWEELNDLGQKILVCATSDLPEFEHATRIAGDPGRGHVSRVLGTRVSQEGCRQRFTVYNKQRLDQLTVTATPDTRVVDTDEEIINSRSVTFDAVSSAHTNGTAASSLTFAHTVAVQSDRYLAGMASSREGQDISTITYNSVALTVQVNFADAIRSIYSDQVAPSTGSNNAVFTFAASTSIVAGVISAYGVDQTTPRTSSGSNTATSTTPSLTLASATGELVLTHTGWNSNIGNTPDATWTTDYDLQNSESNPRCGAGSHRAGAASVTRTDTLASSAAWVVVGAAIKAVALPPPTSGLDAAIVRLAAPTSPGTQDFTKSGFGTPQAALVFCNYGLVNGTIAAHAAISLGAFDGTTQWAAHTRAQDGVALDTFKRSRTAAVVQLFLNNASTIDGEASASLIVDGIRLDWTNAPAGAYLVTVVLLKGFAQVKASTVDLTGLTTNDVDVGFVPDVFINAHGAQTFLNTASVGDHHSIGVVLNTPIENFVSGRGAGDNTDREHGYVGDTRNFVLPEFAGLIREADVTAFITSPVNGVEITRRDAFGQVSSIGYLALKLPSGVSAWAGILNTPTSTGQQAVTAPGFKPKFVLCLSNWQTTTNSVGTGFGATGIGIFTATEQGTVSLSAKDNVNPLVAKSLTDTKVLAQLNDAGTLGYAASAVSLDATGWTWDFTTVDGSARKVIALAIQEETAVAGGAIVFNLQIG